MSLDADVPNREAAMGRLKGPALGLIITASLGALGSLYGFTQKTEDVRKMYEMFNLPKEQVDQMVQVAGPLHVAMSILFLLVNGVIIFGAMKMMKASSHGLAMTACILAFVNCTQCCCLLMIPFAIWGLVVMGKPEVKAAFV